MNNIQIAVAIIHTYKPTYKHIHIIYNYLLYKTECMYVYCMFAMSVIRFEHKTIEFGSVVERYPKLVVVYV